MLNTKPLKIWTPDIKDEDPQQLYLTLISNENNDICLSCVDFKGEKILSGEILFIDSLYKIVQSVKLELEYNRTVGAVPSISFLGRLSNKIDKLTHDPETGEIKK